MIKPEDLAKITGKKVNDNMISVVEGLKWAGKTGKLHKIPVLTHYIAQIGFESMGFIYDQELWGPTDAQRRYEDRSDLGNIYPGDGFRFRGRSAIQLTGRYNYRKFTGWVYDNISKESPNFEKEPDRINENPWEGLAPIWYWTTNNITKYAEDNDIEMVTRKINGGLNGFAERLIWFDKTALTFLGKPYNITAFQREHKDRLVVDGISGKKTRGVMFSLLKELPDSVPESDNKYETAIEKIRGIVNNL